MGSCLLPFRSARCQNSRYQNPRRMGGLSLPGFCGGRAKGNEGDGQREEKKKKKRKEKKKKKKERKEKKGKERKDKKRKRKKKKKKRKEKKKKRKEKKGKRTFRETYNAHIRPQSLPASSPDCPKH